MRSEIMGKDDRCQHVSGERQLNDDLASSTFLLGRETMERNHLLGMICGYYLSRYDDKAYRSLGFGNQRQTHDGLGRALSVPAASIKNWRDEFDPIHDNGRQGWHKRDMLPTRTRLVAALRDYSEEDLQALVSDAIASPTGRSALSFLNASSDFDPSA
jgi:hypothetical protein